MKSFFCQILIVALNRFTEFHCYAREYSILVFIKKKLIIIIKISQF